MVTLNDFCCTVASLFPKALCTGLYIWSYYVVLFKVLLQFVFFDNLTTTVLLVLVTLLQVLGLMTYYFIVTIGPGSPLDFSELCVESYQAGDVISPPSYLVSKNVMVKGDGGFRFCNKCKCWKPDRCHHCSSCGKCILKMDHHCPWFAECIGFRNHKLFIQFLCYTSVYCISVFLICGKVLFDIFYVDEDSSRGYSNYFSLNILFAFLAGAIMGLSVTIFSAFTMYQLLKNRTTIETYEYNRFINNHSSRSTGNLFDLGYSKNWKSVMGRSWVDWLLPTKTTSTIFGTLNDGTSFEIDELLYRQMKSNDELQQRLSSELTNYRQQQKQIQQQGVDALLQRGGYDKAESQRLI